MRLGEKKKATKAILKMKKKNYKARDNWRGRKK